MASKAERLYARSNKFSNGQVLLPRKASWLDTYIDELTSFPDSDFSDQVDSTTQALSWDTSIGNFANAMRAMDYLGGESQGSGKKMKLRVLQGGGVIQYNDGSGGPPIHVPATGEILEVDEDTAGQLLQQWRRFQVVPE